MITIEEAHNKIRQEQVQIKKTILPLSEASGYYLATSIHTPFDLPDFDNSAMDGYAVCGLKGYYQIVGEIAAGDTSEKVLKDGQAMRIFTGGKIPANTTAIVMQEKTAVSHSVLEIKGNVQPGQHIRKKGGELQAGQLVFAAGHPLTPASVGLIASLGIKDIEVFKKPSIGLIITGNELIAPGEIRKPGQIYESNSLTLKAALQNYGYNCTHSMQVEDDYEKTTKTINESLEISDVLLLSGGISVGDYDYVKDALLRNGVEEIFYKVFQKPGKPLFFGRKGAKYVFALPGNPASSLTCFYLYVLPFLQKMSGANEYGLSALQMPLAHKYHLKSDRPSFLKARIADQQVTILDGQGSSMIHSMATGNALVYMAPEVDLNAGDMVTCYLIR